MPLSLPQLRRGNVLDGDSGNDPSVMPEWMDIQRFRRGQAFFQRHITAIGISLHCSLTLGFCIVNLLNPLVYTNKSHTPSKALLRYIQTFVHLVLWHTNDVWDSSTMGHNSVQLVRKMHGRVRESMNKNNPATVHVSQYDMALVQAGFMAIIVMYPLQFGVVCTLQELEDYIFFWRGIGYLLGINDAHNICSGDYSETYTICKEIETDVVIPGLLQPPEKFALMADAYINGVNLLAHLRAATKESVIAFTMDVAGYDRSDFVRLTWLDSVRVVLMKLTVFMIRWCPGYERLCNYLTMKAYNYNLSLVKKQFLVES